MKARHLCYENLQDELDQGTLDLSIRVLSDLRERFQVIPRTGGSEKARETRRRVLEVIDRDITTLKEARKSRELFELVLTQKTTFDEEVQRTAEQIIQRQLAELETERAALNEERASLAEERASLVEAKAAVEQDKRSNCAERARISEIARSSREELAQAELRRRQSCEDREKTTLIEQQIAAAEVRNEERMVRSEACAVSVAETLAAAQLSGLDVEGRLFELGMQILDAN